MKVETKRKVATAMVATAALPRRNARVACYWLNLAAVAQERFFHWVGRLDGWVGGLDPASCR